MNTDSEGRCWYQKCSGSVCSPRGGFSYSQQSEHSWSHGDSVLYELDQLEVVWILNTVTISDSK